jgi:two-component system NtrC family response regulator
MMSRIISLCYPSCYEMRDSRFLPHQTVRKGLKIVQEVDLDIVITDMQMPGMDGMEFLHRIKEKKEALPVIVITAFAEVDKAVAAMQAGAYSYLAKPFSNDELIITLKKGAYHHSLIRENTRLRDEIRGKSGFSGWSGKTRKCFRFTS